MELRQCVLSLTWEVRPILWLSAIPRRPQQTPLVCPLLVKPSPVHTVCYDKPAHICRVGPPGAGRLPLNCFPTNGEDFQFSKQQPTEWLENYTAQPHLTHLGENKMATIFADNIFKFIFLQEYCWILTQISMEFIPKGPIINFATLVQIITWHWTGDKQLPETMMTWFADAYFSHSASMSFWGLFN